MNLSCKVFVSLMENQKGNLYQVKSVYGRIGVILGVVAVVVTVLYFTPMPEEYFLNCDRPCHHLDWPMICRLKVKIEMHRSEVNYCPNCPKNQIDCEKSCFWNGFHTSITINGKNPGPSLHVCQNDIVVVDVINMVQDKSLTLHWRGQSQIEMAYMDGVPMITQCPIPGYTVFQYKFRATSPGTHLWHAYSGKDVADGVFGALVVRQPYRVDRNRHHYEFDLKEHTFVISENKIPLHLMSDKEEYFQLMINGNISTSGSLRYKMKLKRRYRFRLAYVGGLLNCPIRISLDNHLLKVISVDGNSVTAFETSSFDVGKGERIDFVVQIHPGRKKYPLRVTSNCDKSVREVHAILELEEEDMHSENKQQHHSDKNISSKISAQDQKHFSTSFCADKLGQMCVENLYAPNQMPDVLKEQNVMKKIYLMINSKNKVKSYGNQYQSISMVYTMNNISFMYPPAPLLSQYKEVSDKLKCNFHHKPEFCTNNQLCACIHIENIPIGATVELIIINQAEDMKENIFHLHGHQFYVVGSSYLNDSLSLNILKDLDIKGKLIKRNLENRVLKDTIRVPKNMIVALRFFADNPGFWIFRDEMSLDWTRGLDVIFHVGECCDIPTVPPNFPRCGNWIGPDFFLL